MTPDPARCPLCGGENACAMQAAAQGGACWCESETFSRELLARVPEAAQRKACVCARCVRAESEAAAQAR